MLSRIFSQVVRNAHKFKNHEKLRRKILFDNYNVRLTLRVFPALNYASSSNKQEFSMRRIYYGILTPQIKAVKVFSLSSSIVGLIAQPFLYNEIASMEKISIIIAVYSCIGFFTFVTPLLLHMVTKKYVTRLDYIPDKDAYVASTINFLCMSKETAFKLEDVKVPDVPGMFTTLIAKRTALFLDPKMFESPDHYARLMGFDKPIDFKLFEKNTSSSGSQVNTETRNNS